MRGRVILYASLAANVVLAAAWFWSSRQQTFLYTRALRAPAPGPVQTKTAVIVRKQFFSWAEIESNDYPTYIANLRDIACPEPTIRDIIVADVNALYAQKRATEILTVDQQWWRAEPGTNVAQLAAAKSRALDEERRALLTRLLGPNWETVEPAAATAQIRTKSTPVLDGPVLGLLPAETKEAVAAITTRSQEQLQAYLAAQRKDGKPADPAELARLRQQTRTELASVLSPLQLEEFLLRYSQNSAALRTELGQLKFFEATPDEYRAMFRATDPYDVQIQALSGGTDANSREQVQALQDQREHMLQLALGPERYELYRRLHDPAYRDAYAQALAAGAPETAQTLYEINQATAAQQAVINADPTLTASQRAIEAKRTDLQQLEAATVALGQPLPPEPPPAPRPDPKTVHIVASGEGLNRVAQLYGVMPADLRAANPGINFDKLKAGDQISVPLRLLDVPLPTPVK